MDFSCISLDSLYNFTHDWLYYKKSYDEIEAGMAYIGSVSEVLKITWQYFCLQVDRMRKYFWHAAFCPLQLMICTHAQQNDVTLIYTKLMRWHVPEVIGLS